MPGVKLKHLKIHQYRNVRPGTELRFDDVRVSGLTIDGAADLAMECVQFQAARWQPE